jgi:4-hydroxy-tetrahydrodipicolinate synthase
MTGITGTWFVVPTPFDANGELDVASQRTLVDAAIEWGVDGLTVMGVMSEVTSLSDAERQQALEAIVSSTAGRVPIAVGCSAASPYIVRKYLAAAAHLDVAAAMVSAPPLLRNVDLLPRFYESISGVLPIVVQDEPAATGVLIPNSVLLECLDAADSRVVKLEDPPTPPKIAALLKANPGLSVFGGLGGVSAYSELRRGACGTMTGFAFPEVLKAMREAMQAGDNARGGEIFNHYLPLIQFEFQPVVGVAIRKEVLRLRGAISSATTRGIVSSLDPFTFDELVALFERVGVEPSIEPLAVKV